MPELRIDPLTGLRTIVASERADRPGGGLGAEPEPPPDPDTDPFLEGHEDRTPPEIWADRPNGGPADGPGWTARAVPNLYPALAAPPAAGDSGVRPDAGAAAGDSGARPGGRAAAEGPRDPLAAERGEPDLFPSRPATGAHEVIVNTPRAVASLAALAPEQAARAMDAWRIRIRAHPDASYVHVIVNEGRRAGASLPHSHAQLYALPFVPAAVARERERFTAYANRTHGRDLLADVLQEEVRRRERVVAINGDAVALCPFASRVPFQVQIVPRQPRPRFEDDGPLASGLLQEVLRRLGSVLGGPPALNMWVRTAPRGAEHFCWRIDLLPRLVNDAGLELGAGLHLNVLAPERGGRAAARTDPLRVASAPCRPPTAPSRCFAAEPPQEPLPYGRWAEALGERFRDACVEIETDEEVGEVGEITWFPDRTWGGRTYIPASAPSSNGFELFGFVSFTREHDGRGGHRLRGERRLHGRHRRRQPRLEARPLATRRSATGAAPGARGADHAGVGRGAGAKRRGGHRRARPHHDGPVRAGRRPLHADLARQLHRRPARGEGLGPRRRRARVRVAVRRGLVRH